MKNEKIWAFFLMLSDHFADDASGPPRGLYLEKDYRDENRIDLKVWNDTVSFLAEHKFNTLLIDVGDQVLYESHPEISAPNAFKKEFVKKMLDGVRAKGLTPIPKLNFSACHHTWLREYTRMVGSAPYYKVVSDLIAEVCELFDTPPFFHLGLDEEDYDCQKSCMEKVLIRGADLWWHDLYFYFGEVEKNGVRPWMWSDYFWRHPRLFLEKMPKSVLQSNWYYSTFRNYPPVPEGRALSDAGYQANRELLNAVKQEAYEKLDRAGFDQVPTCSSYSSRRNAFQTMCFCRDHISDERLLGFLTAPWLATDDEHKYAILNDAYRFYNGRKKAYPETL